MSKVYLTVSEANEETLRFSGTAPRSHHKQTSREKENPLLFLYKKGGAVHPPADQWPGTLTTEAVGQWAGGV